MRPLVFVGDGVMGLHPQNNPIRSTIYQLGLGPYLGDEGLAKGIRAKISSFSRHHVNVMMTKAKTTANYVNSIWPKREATALGYDEALLLDTDGYVAEASGENIFLVCDGVLRTPPITAVLSGITRASIITLAQGPGHYREGRHLLPGRTLPGRRSLPHRHRRGGHSHPGSGRRLIGPGKPGPITLKLQAAFFDIVKGKDSRYQQWLTLY